MSSWYTLNMLFAISFCEQILVIFDTLRPWEYADEGCSSSHGARLNDGMAQLKAQTPFEFNWHAKKHLIMLETCI